MGNSEWQITDVCHWLAYEGRFLDEGGLLKALGHQLVSVGAPVWRLSLGFRMLHPQIRGASGYWQRDTDEVSTRRVSDQQLNSEQFHGSPIQALFETGEKVRRRIDSQSALEHGLYAELYSEGYTDYVALPVAFSDGTLNFFIIATKVPAGFAPADIEKLETLSQFLAPVVEVLARQQAARSLLDTYVGKRTGTKVLQGMISRGDAETIEAALWFSDLRNFTHYTESLPGEELLVLLNTYFEFVAAAVTARGGEILRFIGDAMLIVFPVQANDTGVREACESALDAARDAFSGLATFNHRRRRIGLPVIEFGVGLNVGTVIYGNVGAPDRLDFTVMGPAVNRVARLESLTKTLGENILMSRVFADALDQPTRSMGSHTMKGVAEPQEVLAPAE